VQLAGVQPMTAHTFARPSIPQPLPVGHEPQSILPPQPLPTTPQYWPDASTHSVGVQPTVPGVAPHTFEMPPAPQLRGAAQLPQSSARPHPSPMEPQYVPPTWAQVRGAHPSTSVLQTFCTQACPPVQSPQSSVPPQPSPITPQ